MATEIDALQRWRELQPTQIPPTQDLVLWRSESRTIYVEAKWGPAVPYPPVPRTDSESNYGYRRVKGNADALASIPELQEWPEYGSLVRTVNRDSSPLESVGCAVGFLDQPDASRPPVYVGSYIDLIYSDARVSQGPEPLIKLAGTLMDSVKGCEAWWASVEMGLQRFKCFPGTATPWGMLVRVTNYGRDKPEARECFGVTIQKLETAFSLLDQSFA